jgi:DNA mismatch endonuclease (patch repair protein)
MRAIKGKNTKPELAVRSYLHREGLRYRLHVRALPGSPDIVLAGRRLVIQVNGCFWHSHDCKNGSVLPKTNSEFWATKRLATVERDKRNKRVLRDMGWRVVEIWECEITALLNDNGDLAARIRSSYPLAK